MTDNETKITPLLQRLPELAGGKMPPVDVNLTNELVQAVLKDGKPALTGLIDALREVDDGGDWKARFLLQAVVCAAGAPGQDAPRAQAAAVLLEEAAGPRPAPVRTFLLARLRLIADQGMVPKLVPLLAADDAPLADAAAAVLVSLGAAAKAPLTQALRTAQGRAKDVIANALAQVK